MDRIAPDYLKNPWFFQFDGSLAADTAAETLAGFAGDGLLSLASSWQYLPPPAAAPVATAGLPTVVGPSIDHGSGLVGDTGDADVNGPEARGTFDLDGTGIRIGIISDSFNVQGGAAAEELDGDLPATVTVLSDASTGSDEGRAMAELVHQIAPGAQIYFATEGGSEGSSAQAVASLQAAGCNIIVDDINWASEPFFQDGSPLQTAIETATSSGVSYFTSAGNLSDHYYQGKVGTFPTLEISSSTGGSIEIDLQWTQPYASFPVGATGSAYSLGWTLYFHGTTTVVPGQTSQPDEDTRNPVQADSVNLPVAGSYDLVITNNGTGSLVTTDIYKVTVNPGDNTQSVSLSGPAGIGTGSGTVYGHELPASVNAVGAVDANDPTQVEPYSAYGPGEVYYDAAGDPLATPLDEDKPNFLAPDDITTSVSTWPIFAGTSAAAPNAAAVGALLLQLNPNLTPAEIQAALAATASTADLVGAPAQFGAGLINAFAAAQLIDSSVVAWNHASGAWTTAADWSNAANPAATSYVTLGDDQGTLTASYSVALGTAAGTVATLTVGDAATISAALSVAAGGALVVAGGATVGHDGQVTIAATGSLQVGGLLQLDDTMGTTATLELQANARASAGSFAIVGGAASVAALASLAVTGDGTVGEGNAGTLAVAGRASVGGNLVVNPVGDLTIEAGGSLGIGGTLTLEPGPLAPGATAAIGAGATLSTGELWGSEDSFFEPQAQLGIGNGATLIVSSGNSSYLTGFDGGLATTLIEPDANGHTHVLLSGVAFAGASLHFVGSGSVTVEIKNGGSNVADLDFDTSLPHTSFSSADVAGHIEINIACYQRGTRIATRAGEVPVEALRIGDGVLTRSGVLRPIHWIGWRGYTAAQAAAQPSLRPIRIAAGALGPLLPRRDLLVSSQHALLLRDPGHGRPVLVPAVQLVNGATIAREPAGVAPCYFHIELASHDVILAEGQPAETFVDRDSRAAFDNAGEYARLYPEAPAQAVPFCAPRIEGGAALARIRAAIEDWGGVVPGRLVGSVDRVTREWVEGWAHDLDTPGGPVLLEVLVDGALAGSLLADQFRADLAAMNGGGCAFYFRVPAGFRMTRKTHLTVRRVRDRREVLRTMASRAADGLALAGAEIPA